MGIRRHTLEDAKSQRTKRAGGGVQSAARSCFAACPWMHGQSFISDGRLGGISIRLLPQHLGDDVDDERAKEAAA